jgi:hypothetical protein
MFISTTQPLDIGASIVLSFRLSTAERKGPLRVFGKVCRRCHRSAASEGLPGMGIEFERVDAQTKRAIAAYVTPCVEAPAPQGTSAQPSAAQARSDQQPTKGAAKRDKKPTPRAADRRRSASDSKSSLRSKLSSMLARWTQTPDAQGSRRRRRR